MNRIKLLREEKGWTQLELAKKMNCAMSSIAMYENENRKPSYEVLLKLSELFDCSIDYIVNNSDIRNSKQESDINDALIQVGFDMKEYNPPTEKQKEQIKALIEVVLKDNKKDKKD